MPSDLAFVSDWDGFRAHLLNPACARLPCRLGGDPFPWRLPTLDPLHLLDDARRHPAARILRQRPAARFDLEAIDAARIRALPIAEAADEPHLHVSLFDIGALLEPGAALSALGRDALPALAEHWKLHGAEAELGYALFITGSASATNYHIDPMPTLPWHLFGEKRFHGLRDPLRWCGQDVRDEFEHAGRWPTRPDGITGADCLTHDNRPGDAVWIPRHEPHWVDARSFSATLTVTFRGLAWRAERSESVAMSG